MPQKGMMIVLNSVSNDSRVVKMAAAMSRIFKPFVLVGVYPTSKSNGDVTTESIAGLKCYKFPNYSRDARPGAIDSDDERLRQRRESVDFLQRRIAEFAARFEPDCIHTHDMYTLPIGRRIKEEAALAGRNVTWVHDIHEFTAGSSHMPPPLQKYALELEREHVAHADHHITVTEELRAELLTLYPAIRDLRVIYNAPAVFPPTPSSHQTLREALEIGQAPLAVYSGVVKAKRGVERMIPVLQRLPDLHLGILTGSSSSAFSKAMMQEAKAAEVADRIHWHPYVDPTEVVRFLEGADVGVIPIENYGNAEVALPNKLFEYCFAGMPVVSHELTAISSFLNRYPVGFTTNFADPDAAAGVLRKTLDEDVRAQAKALRHEIVAKYSWETQERCLIEFYMGICKLPSRRVVDPVSGIGTKLEGLRVLHGISAAAGQPNTLARALDRKEGISARSLQISASSFGYLSDLIYPVKMNNVETMHGLIRSIINDFDIFHLHYRGFFHDPEAVAFPTGMDLLLLKALGKGLVVHFRGSEVRLQSVFRAMSRYHYVDEDAEGTVSAFPEAQKRMFISLVSAIADRVFVTDPELATYVPGAEIVERAIDLAEWPFVGISETDRPLVLHAPSRRGVKGTQSILDAIERLRSRGLTFDFQLVENLPHSEARKLYEKADIIVDQLRIGWYGVLAVEAMALGKPVIAYIRDDLLHHLGSEPPLAVANPNDIESVLGRLIASNEERKVLSAQGRKYCEAVHSDDRVASKLVAHYRELRKKPRPIDANIVLDHIVRQHGELNRRLERSSLTQPDAVTAARKIASQNWQRVQYLGRVVRREGVSAAYNLLLERLRTRPLQPPRL